MGVWMEANGFSLAPDKSKAVLLVLKRTIREISARMEDRTIEPQEAVRYLGVEFQRNFRVADQVERVVRKADRVPGLTASQCRWTQDE